MTPWSLNGDFFQKALLDLQKWLPNRSLTASNDKIKARCWIWLTFHRFLGKYPWIYHHTFWELYFLCFKKREKPQSRRCLSMKFKSKKQNKTKKQKNQNFLWTHWAVTTLKIPTSNWLYWIIADNPYIYFSYNDHLITKKLSLTMITSIHSKNEKINFKLKIENYNIAKLCKLLQLQEI